MWLTVILCYATMLLGGVNYEIIQSERGSRNIRETSRLYKEQYIQRTNKHCENTRVNYDNKGRT